MKQSLFETLLGLEPAPWTGESEWELQWTALPSGVAGLSWDAAVRRVVGE